MNDESKTIGDWYAAKDEEARQLSEALDGARKRNAPIEVIRRLERLLEQARYVGD